jgi:hypothetical protein
MTTIPQSPVFTALSRPNTAQLFPAPHHAGSSKPETARLSALTPGDQVRFGGAAITTNEQQDLFFKPFERIYRQFLADISSGEASVTNASRDKTYRKVFNGAFEKGYVEREQKATFNVGDKSFEVLTEAFYPEKKEKPGRWFSPLVIDDSKPSIPKLVSIRLPELDEQIIFYFTYPESKWSLRYRSQEELVRESFGKTRITYRSQGNHPFQASITLTKPLAPQEAKLIKDILASVDKACKGT